YTKAIELDPDSAEAHINLGAVLQQEGQFAKALEELRRGDALGRRRPGWPFPSAEWVRQCERLAELDGRRAGLLRGETAGVAAPDLLTYALSRNRQGQRREEAIALLRQAVALQPDFAEAHDKLGWELQGLGQWEQALAEVRTAIRLKPEVGWYHND